MLKNVSLVRVSQGLNQEPVFLTTKAGHTVSGLWKRNLSSVTKTKLTGGTEVEKTSEGLKEP